LTFNNKLLEGEREILAPVALSFEYLSNSNTDINIEYNTCIVIIEKNKLFEFPFVALSEVEFV